MRRWQLPYRREINLGAVAFCGLPVFIYSLHLLDGLRVEQARQGLVWFGVPLLLFALAYLPVFRFKPAAKVSVGQALLRLPVPEFIILTALVLSAAGVEWALIGLLRANHPAAGVWLTGYGLLLGLLLGIFNSRRVLLYEELQPAKTVTTRVADPDNLGVFAYTATGFSCRLGRRFFACEWTEVRRVAVFKTDGFYVDRMHLLLQKDNGEELATHEDMAGWQRFRQQLNTSLHGADPVWELRVMATSDDGATLIYEKNRDLTINWLSAFPT